MATTTLNGNDIPLKISTDAGTTYKSVVCATTSGIEITRDIVQKPTKCGDLTTVGNAKWSANVEGVVNTTPTALTEVSYEDLLGIIVNNTATLIKVESPVAAGTDFYIQGTVIMTGLNLSMPSGDFVEFTCTLTGSGVIDITP